MDYKYGIWEYLRDINNYVTQSSLKNRLSYIWGILGGNTGYIYDFFQIMRDIVITKLEAINMES